MLPVSLPTGPPRSLSDIWLDQVVPGTQQAAPDSVVADTSDAIGQVGREMGDAVNLLVTGEFDSFGDIVVGAGRYLLVNFVPDLVSAFILFALMYVAYRVTRKVISETLRKSRKVDAGLQGLLVKSFTVVGWTFISVMVLAQFGVNVSALLAGLSIAGIAVGFAAKDSLENFISGITILVDRPFRVGDQVVVEDQYGTVEEITLRSTRLRTQNNEIVVMPNVLMISQRLTNHALHGLLRVEVPFGIAYKESPREAREIVLDLLEDDDRILAQPEPKVVVTELGGSSVNMVLRFYIRETSKEIPLRAEYTEKVFYALGEADIEIPFPHLQLFIDEAKGLHPELFHEPSQRSGETSGETGGGESS